MIQRMIIAFVISIILAGIGIWYFPNQKTTIIAAQVGWFIGKVF